MGGPINGLKQIVSIPSVVGSVLLGAVLTHLGGGTKVLVWLISEDLQIQANLCSRRGNQ